MSMSESYSFAPDKQILNKPLLLVLLDIECTKHQ